MRADDWYVVQTQLRGEETAARNLRRQGYETFWPRYRRLVRHARRRHEVLRPLFPGYVFVRLDVDVCRWRSINGTLGVRCILGDGLRPRAVPEPIMAEILSRTDPRGEVRLLTKGMVPGQAVRLVEGPLADVTALLEEIGDEERVTILLSVLGRPVRVKVSLADLQSAA